MNKIVYFFAITHLFIATSVVFAMEKPIVQSFTQRYHTHDLFDDFDKTLDQTDRRSLRATFASIWRATPMPKKLDLCTNKQQTNCAFLAAVHYAAVEKKTKKNNYLIKWVLDYRKDPQFSFYMQRACNNIPQEYHINPQYVATANNDQETLDLLQHNGHVQKPIFTGVFYLPGPLLWACIGNNLQQAKTALSHTEEIGKLLKEPECVIDCMYVAMQNGSTKLANMLLKHDDIKKLYLAYGSSCSPRHSPQHSPRECPSTTSNKKDKHLSVPKARKRLSRQKTEKANSTIAMQQQPTTVNNPIEIASLYVNPKIEFALSFNKHDWLGI